MLKKFGEENRDYIGTITSINGSGKTLRITVEWDNGLGSSSYSSRAIDPYVEPNSVDIPSVQHENASEHEQDDSEDDFDELDAAEFESSHGQPGTLAIEHSWKTECWRERAFSTVWGMIIVDSFFCFRHIFRSKHPEEKENCPTLIDFARQMIYDNATSGQEDEATTSNSVLGKRSIESSVEYHRLTPTSTLARAKGGYPQLRCTICKKADPAVLYKKDNVSK
eukprot:gene3467-3797_t